MGFPTKNDHFGVFWGYHHLRKHPDAPPAKHRTKIAERTKQRRMAFKDYTEVMEPMLLGRRVFFCVLVGLVGSVGFGGYVNIRNRYLYDLHMIHMYMILYNIFVYPYFRIDI